MQPQIGLLIIYSVSIPFIQQQRMQSDEFSQRLQLIEAQKDLKDLRAAQLVPPLMLAKLTFLAALIEREKVSENVVEQLPYFERQTLEELQPNAQVALFISIVRCLAGKEVINYCRRERAYLRKEKGFFGWKKCYLDCNTRHVTLFDSRHANVPFQQMDIANLWISRYYKYYKKKTIFAVYHQNIKFVLGFDQQTTCKRIHETLTSLVSEHRQWQCTKFDPLLALQQQKGAKLGPQNRQVEEAILSEELEYLNCIHAKIARYDLSDNGFKLFKNIGCGRIMVNESQGILRVSLILKDVNQLSLLENYALQKWNTSVQSLTIMGKPRSNSYLAQLCTNKYSIVSYPRECLLSIIYYQSCSCRAQPVAEGSSYLLIESIAHDQPALSGAVRMDLKQIVELSRSKEDSSLILMTVTTEANFKGYATLQDNIAMALHLVGNFEDLITYTAKNRKQTMFQNLPCPCKREGRRRGSRIFSDFTIPTEQNLSNDDEFSQRENSRLVARKMSYKSNENEMMVMLEALMRGVRNDAILDMMKSKKHERYALRHRFTDSDQVIRTFEGENRDFLLQGKKWMFKGDEFDFVDQQALAAQKDILKMIIKQLGTNLMSGKSIMNMSLPVEIFDKRSMLDVIADSLGFISHYLTKAVLQVNPVEQLKLVVCAFMFMSATNPNIEKPFNPILGETYQGQIGCFHIALEQISHHPPISAIYMRSKDVEFYGNFDVSLDMGLNSAYSRVNSWFYLKIFPTNSSYKIKIPDIELGGLMYGSRTLKLAHRGYVYEQNSHLFCEMSIGKDKKRIYEQQKLGAADLAGGIFKVRPEFGEKVMLQTGKKTFQGLKPEDVMENCCFLSGKWYGNIFFDGVPYKSLTNGPFPDRSFKLKYLLPSDSIFRQDVIFKIWKDNEGSNRQKQRLENLQRADRKLREKMGKK